jgi:hypothetical protein
MIPRKPDHATPPAAETFVRPEAQVPADAGQFYRVREVEGAVVVDALAPAAVAARAARDGVTPAETAADMAEGGFVAHADDLPEAHGFAAALRAKGKRLAVDMDAARELAREEVRRARDLLFAPLDVAALRALEARDDAALGKASAAKAALRDAPDDARLAKAKTPAALRAAVDAVKAGLPG